MSKKAAISTPLEERFTQPDGWVSGTFTSPETSHHLHYGHIQAENPSGVVVLLGGLSEYSEKYFETIRDLLKRDLSVYTFDWFGQGASERYLPNREKRHSEGFEKDIADLSAFMDTIVTKQNENNLPVILMAHSMGAHIGVRYILENPNVFSAMAMSAPLFDIHGIRILPLWLREILLWVLKPFYTSYVLGGGDWTQDTRNEKKNNRLSCDPIRREIHEYWCETKPHLRVGSPTFGWVKAAIHSCNILQHTNCREIKIPMLITLAKDEKLVDNIATHRIFDPVRTAKIIEIPDAKHEIFMERDIVRDQFFKSFDKMLVDRGIFR